MEKVKGLLPDGFQVVAQICLAIIIVAVVCAPALALQLGYNGATTQSFLQTGLVATLRVLGQNKIVPTLIVIAFWGSIGFVVYLLTWIGVNLAIEARNEAVLDTTYANRDSMLGVMRRPLEHLAMGLGFLVLLVAAILSLKFWSSLGNQGILLWPAWSSLLYIAGAVAGTTACLYILTVAWRLTRWVAAGRVRD